MGKEHRGSGAGTGLVFIAEQDMEDKDTFVATVKQAVFFLRVPPTLTLGQRIAGCR